MIKTYDTSSELLIQRYQGGIRLLKPDTIDTSHIDGLYRVGDILALPMNCYFINRDSLYVQSNARNAEVNGYTSIKDVINRGPRDVVNEEFAGKVIANNNFVMSSQETKILEEYGNRSDDMPIQSISFKMPWYYDDRVVGLFGMSVMVQHGSLSNLTNCLTKLMPTGLLGAACQVSNSLLPSQSFKGKYFTRKEYEVLPLLIRGRTASEIAEVLSVSKRTIEHRIERIKLKFNCSTKAELLDVLIGHLV